MLIPSFWEKIGLGGKNKAAFDLSNFDSTSSISDFLDDLDADEKDFLEIADEIMLNYFMQTNLKMPAGDIF